jgi:hypothetical protein
MIFDTTLDRVPCGVIFWRADDGVKVYGGRRVQEYAPRASYWKLDDSDSFDVRELREFGRSWTFSDCGLAPDTAVRTLFQPIAKRFTASATRALRAAAETSV